MLSVTLGKIPGRIAAVIAFALFLSACGGGDNVAVNTNNSTTSNPTPTGSAGSLGLSAASDSITQGTATLTITVNRTSGSSGAVSVAYATANGTAVAGTDYTAANGTLNWADGDANAKTFTVPVSNATPFSGTKTFTLTLSGASGGATLGTSSATVTITGNAVAGAVGSLMLTVSSYTVAQSAGSQAVTVNRTGGSSGAISVAYATANGTAVAGTDYTATSGTLNWATSDANAKTFSVPISNTTPFTGNKAFTVSISNPSGGATLGSPTSATVTIAGSAGTGSGGPSAVSNLQLVNQGGPHNTDPNNGNASNNYQAIKWDPATAGADAIDHYNIYRNGTLYTTQTTQTVFQGYISGTTLTVTAVTSGTVLPGVRYSAPGILAETLINANQISGTTGAAGTYQVNRSQTLGSSSSPVSFSAWQYIDASATNSNSITFSQPTTAYVYNVAAVDTQGNVGPQASQMSVYVYQNGFSNWNNYDLSYGGVVGANENYASTAGSPQGGPFDISVFYLNGGFQPASYGPQAPVDDLEIGAFNYMVMDVNPGPTAGYALQMGSESRLPPGDDGHWQGAGLNVFAYGPTPVANTWATYKIPLTAMGFGTCTFTGSISGTTLTVTAVGANKGACVDSDGYITGANVPSGTYVTTYNQSSSIGTFTIAGPGISGSTSVPSGPMTWQRTNMYKFGSQTSTNQTQVYMNNIRFTVN